MIYCHECGSEVAETDAFCPYCGITLVKPEAPAEEPVETAPETEPAEEFDSTIVMTPAEFAAEKAAFAETEPDAAEIIPEAEPVETIEPEAVPETEVDNEHGEVAAVVTREDGPDDIDIDSVPTPGVIADLEKSLYDASPEAGEQSVEEVSDSAEEQLPEEQLPEEQLPKEDVWSPEPVEETIEEHVVSELPVEEVHAAVVDPEENVAEISAASLEEETSIAPVNEAVVENNVISEPEPATAPVDAEEPAAAAEETTPQTENIVETLPTEIAAEPAEIASESNSFGATAEPDSWAEAAREPEEIPVETQAVEDPVSDEASAPESDTGQVSEALAEDHGAVESTDDEPATGSAADLSDPGIGMPSDADALDASDPYLQASQFDSVRIVDQEAFRPDPADGSRFVDPVAHATTGDADAAGSGEVSGRTDSGKKAAKLTPLKEGTVLLNRYEIVRKIGGGGMGAVYLASDNNLGGVVRAVKEMVQAHIAEDQQQKAIEDFKRESMILSSLDHVSIPTIFDYFYDENEGRFYLVMKYISGGDLAGRLRAAPEGKIDEMTVTGWALQITEVLDYLHSQPSTIVYRDLKPSNIMIDGNSGRIMLIDFGIARSINQKEEKGVTAVGTMGYAPPELFSGKVEPRSDIYSLGSTMFHLLTGADPQSNPLLIFDFQKNPRPRQINPQLSDQIETILMRAVEYNADSRFASSAEMRSVLEEHLENLKAGRVTYGVSEAPASVSLANQSVFCGFCGQNIVATDLFCAFCGAKQPIAQHGVHSEIYSVESHPAKLVIQASAELQGSNYTLIKSENLIGRRDPMSNIFPEIDLTKYDPQTKISRRHAKVWNDGSKYFVEDLGSSNGTLLTPRTGELLRLAPHRPHPIVNGDMIKVGDTTLHFVVS